MSLSRRVVSEDDLVKLGVTGLKLPDYRVQAALSNRQESITSAAYAVLREWLHRKKNRDEAFTELQRALHWCEMNNLATQLVTHFSDESQRTQMSTQRE